LDPHSTPLSRKTSFYFALLLLPPEQRRAMEALYRFCWAADEISDGPGTAAQKKRRLSAMKQGLAGTFRGRPPLGLFHELGWAVRRFRLSREPLERLLKGVERDLKPVRFRSFGELHRYALQVAGGPGLSSMEVFGFRDRAHRDYAENLGVFLQIVNITRDFREDSSLGRWYLPMEDFRRYRLDPDRIVEGDSRWRPFTEFQLDRAWTFLEKSRRSLTPGERSLLATAEAISAVYVKLYQKLRNRPYRILQGKVALSKADKMLSAAGAWARCSLRRWVKGS
jgi:15-cis-phytoene synthase